MFDPHSAYEVWTGSVMGHSARDPLFLSALTEAEKDSPGIGDFCLRCHAPAAWLEGRCVPTDGSALLEDDAGVTCAFCHRLDPSPWHRNGQYLVGDDITYRGPYSDATAPHHKQQSDFISDSALCGACHDLWNPRVGRVALDGTPMPLRFHEQTTYTEWAASDYANGEVMERRTCQSCHLPEEPGRVASMGPVRPDRSVHAFAGGNVFALAAIGFLDPGLGLAQQLAAGQSRAEAMLRIAAELSLVSPAPEAQLARGRPFTLEYRVTNLTGHKLPTGYPEGRRVWLSVRSSTPAIELGAFDAMNGEPVHPAAIYRTVQGRFGVGPGHRLALNDQILEDTRIPPKGMVVTATTAPVGKTYPEVSPGVLAHFDRVTVTATVPCDASLLSVHVSASLWYQSVTKAYVTALVAENGADPRGVRLGAAFEEADPGPYEMVKLESELAIDPASSCAPPDSGVPPSPDAETAQDASSSDGGARDAGAIDTGQTVEPNADSGGCACTSYASSKRGWPDGLAALWLLVLSLARSRKRSRG